MRLHRVFGAGARYNQLGRHEWHPTKREAAEAGEEMRNEGLVDIVINRVDIPVKSRRELAEWLQSNWPVD